MKKITEVSAGIIPLRLSENNWQIFLIQHKNGNHWGFPKGKVNKAESFKDAAIRELREETNLKPIKFITEKPFKESYHFYRNHQEVEKQVYYYLVQVEGIPKLQENEVKDGMWLSFKEAFSYITFNESKFIFTQVQELIRNIHS